MLKRKIALSLATLLCVSSLVIPSDKANAKELTTNATKTLIDTYGKWYTERAYKYYEYADYSYSVSNEIIGIKLHYDNIIVKINSRIDTISRFKYAYRNTCILQACLKKLTGWDMQVDGIFGPQTEAAVKAIQKRAGIDQDGICGPKTWTAINYYLPGRP